VDIPAEADSPDPETTRTRVKAPARADSMRVFRAAEVAAVGVAAAALEGGRRGRT
jgi:hypothetical protein